VFHDDDIFLLREGLDDLSRLAALVDVEVRRWLVEEVDVGLFEHRCGDRHALQLAARQLRDVPIQERFEVEGHRQLGEATSLVDLRQEISDTARVNLAQFVDILRLDGGGEFLVRNLREVVVELRSGEVVEHFFPIGFFSAVVAEIRRDLSAQEADAGGLADTVRAEQADDLPLLRTGRRKRRKAFFPY